MSPRIETVLNVHTSMKHIARHESIPSPELGANKGMKTLDPGVSPLNRRGFLGSMGAVAAAAAVGSVIPFGRHMPTGYIPVALSDSPRTEALSGKRGLRILNDRPVNAETPVTLLDDEITPNDRHFIRNNGLIPARATSRDLAGWTLTIDGEVNRSLRLDMDALKTRFEIVEAALVLECGGNGRAGFHPPATGNQWTLGAVGCALYRGVRLGDVLRAAGVKSTAVYIGYHGEDPHLSGDPSKAAISRGVPIEKAIDPGTLLVWEMNGEALPDYHGFPLRLICPGWPASTSGKWLKRISIRDRVHDGAKMTGYSYRVPKYPVAPGTEVPEADMEIIEEMPVKSIITSPGSGIEVESGKAVAIRGHAWSGSGDVAHMHLSLDFGATWIPAVLQPPRNRYAWQRWELSVVLPRQGYYELWARATDETGKMQPMVVPGWNPRGYLNNAMHRIALRAV